MKSNISQCTAEAANRSERQRLGWIVLAGTLLFGAMCVPFFRGQVYTADDLGAFHLPVRDFYAKQLAADEPWDWMPALFCGFYLTGEGQVGGYHPLHFLLYKSLPLGVAFNLELLLCYPLLAFGNYLFLRRLVVRRDAAAFGALLFTFCGFNLLHFVHPNAIAIIAHLPWLLWLLDIACRSQLRSQIRLALGGIALLTGSQLLLGYPQYVWFSMLCETAYVFIVLRRSSRRLSMVLGLLTAVTLGVLIGGIQMMPTFDALRTSSRQTVTAEFRASGSLHPINLVQLVGPYTLTHRVPGENTHELGLYLGAVPLVLCYFVWLNRKRWGRLSQILLPTFLLSFLALLYAMGGYGPVYVLQSWLPVVGNFRFPCRAVVLIELGVAVIAAVGFMQLVRNCWSVSRELAIPAVLSGAFACYAPLAIAETSASPVMVALGPILIVVATGLVFWAATGRQLAAVLLILFAAIDLGGYGLSYAVLRGNYGLNEYVAHQSRPPTPVHGRIAVNTGSANPRYRHGNQLAMAGFSLADGYAGLEPARRAAEREDVWLPAAAAIWQRSANSWQPVAESLPRFRFDAAAGEIGVVDDRPGRMALVTKTSLGANLLIAESFHPGWNATLDETVVPIMQTPNGFMQVPITVGKRQLNLRFEPASLWYGRWTSFVGLGLTVCWMAAAVAWPHQKKLPHLPSIQKEK